MKNTSATNPESVLTLLRALTPMDKEGFYQNISNGNGCPSITDKKRMRIHFIDTIESGWLRFSLFLEA